MFVDFEGDITIVLEHISLMHGYTISGDTQARGSTI
jgi:hypothetical protein